jgi:hypothetical protein
MEVSYHDCDDNQAGIGYERKYGHIGTAIRSRSAAAAPHSRTARSAQSGVPPSIAKPSSAAATFQ